MEHIDHMATIHQPVNGTKGGLFRKEIINGKDRTKLTHCDLVTPYGDMNLGQHIGSGNGLLPDGTKPLPEPMLTYHQ